MTPLVQSLLLTIEALLTLVILALLAGFSPSLYVIHASVASKSTRTKNNTLAIALGVIIALALLLTLFQFFNLDTLLDVVGSTINALIMSTIVNLLVGAACIYGGAHYITHRTSLIYSPRVTVRRTWPLVSFGFLKTLLSVSGITATFLGGNLIATISPNLLARTLLTTGYLITAALPFLVITHLLAHHPDKVHVVSSRLAAVSKKLPYRYILGVAMITAGAIILVVQLITLWINY